METTWGFDEELKPAGELGQVRLLTDGVRSQQSGKLRAVRVKTHPWFVIIWEKLSAGNLPGPEQTHVWCCYISTVIFYRKPWTETSNGTEYERYASIDCLLRTDDVIEFEGERFEVGPGQIVWYDGCWYSREWAKRI